MRALGKGGIVHWLSACPTCAGSVSIMEEGGDSEIASWVRGLATKPDDLSLIPRTNIIGDDTHTLSSDPHTYSGTYA